MTLIISVKNVSKTFTGRNSKVKALDNVSLEIGQGTIFGLLGPNGAGKTTLISIMAGLILPDSGELSIDGNDPRTGNIQESVNVLSGFSEPLHGMSVRELLRYYGYLYGNPSPDKKVDELLKLVGLADRKNEMASYLSSGLKQRFYIAKSLINDPKILFLDEPTVGLDVKSALRLRQQIAALKQQGRTMVLTTHNMREAEELCDLVAIIYKGRIIHTGTVAGMKKQNGKKDFEEIFLAMTNSDDEDG
jgi:ABC-2 type transport system ATP-binding protein